MWSESLKKSAISESITQHITPETVIRELELINSSLRSSLKIRGYLENPRIPLAEKQKVLTDLFKDYVSQKTYEFIFLLLRTNALPSLNDILKSYRRTKTDTGILEIEVKTTVPLTSEEKGELASNFEKKLKKPVTIKNIIDPNIIGGMVIKTGDLLIDASIRAKIQGLLKNLKQG